MFTICTVNGGASMENPKLRRGKGQSGERGHVALDVNDPPHDDAEGPSEDTGKRGNVAYDVNKPSDDDAEDPTEELEGTEENERANLGEQLSPDRRRKSR
jgi:hypothetical protein